MTWLCLAMLALAPGVHAVEAPELIRLEPGMWAGGGSDGISPGLMYEVRVDVASRPAWRVASEWRGECITDASLTRRPLITELQYEWFGAPVRSLGLGCVFRHEADQRFHQQDLAAGLELGLQSRSPHAFSHSFVMGLDAVHSIDEPHSRHTDGAVDKDHLRMRFAAGLAYAWDAGRSGPAPASAPLSVHLDVEHQALHGAERSLDDETTFIAVTLRQLLASAAQVWQPDGMYVRCAGGRVPPAEESGAVFTFGVTKEW